MTFEPISHNTLESALRLSTQAGWNQTLADWERLMRLPSVSAGVWVDDGEVRASYSVATLGPELAWIGMILVDTAYRGRGLGKGAFESALYDCAGVGTRVVGLDATELGEPIYRKFGFQPIAPVVRWAGSIRPVGSDLGRFTLRMGMHREIEELDRSLAGCNRSEILAEFGRCAGIFSLWESETLCAFAAVRPGRTASQIGPVVAVHMDSMDALIEQIAIAHEVTPMLCDVVNPEADEAFHKRGLIPKRKLMRMTLPSQPGCLFGPGLWCGAGFEWG